MKIIEAKVGVEYRLIPKTTAVNGSFKDAKIVFTRITGREARINYWLVTGSSGDTSIQLNDTNWEIDPILKDWDI